MRMSQSLGGVVAATLFSIVAGCASTTPYSSVGENGEYGFIDQKIESNRYRITFRGNALTSRDTVETYLLYRAAELTLANGFEHFIVVSDETEKETSYTGASEFQRYPFFYGRGRPFPYYGYGYRWDPFVDDFSIRERNRYTAMVNIVMGKGAKPADTLSAYTAAEVVENLGPLVVRPGAK